MAQDSWTCDVAADEAALQTLLRDIRSDPDKGLVDLGGDEIVHRPGVGYVVTYHGPPAAPVLPPGDFLYGSNARQTPPRDGIILRNDDVASWSQSQGMMQNDPNRCYRNQSIHYLGQDNPTDGIDSKARQIWRWAFQGQSFYYPWLPYTGSGLEYYQWDGASWSSEYFDLLPGVTILGAKLWLHPLDPGYGPTYIGGLGTNLTVSLDFHRMLEPWENGTGGPEFGGFTWNMRLQWDPATLRPELAGSSHPGPTPWTVPGALGGPEVAPVASFTALIPDRSQYNWFGPFDCTTDVQYWIDNPDYNFGWLICDTPGSGIDWSYWGGRYGYGLRPQIEITLDSGDCPSIWLPGASWGDKLP